MQDQEQEVARRSAWIDSALIRDAKTIAAHEGISTSEVIERNLRPSLGRDMKRLTAKLADHGGEG